MKRDLKSIEWPKENRVADAFSYSCNAYAELLKYGEEDDKSIMEYNKITVNSKNIFGVGSKPQIKNVHFNPPMTIVIWTDGTKTFVKAHNELFDPEKGLAMAIAKKFIGDNKYDYIEEINKWVEKYDGPPTLFVDLDSSEIPELEIHHLGEYVARGFTDGIHDNDPELQKLAKKQLDIARESAEIHIEPSGSAILSGKSSWHISTSLYWDEAEFKCRNCGCKITTTKDKKAPDTCPICNCYMESKDSDS